MLSLKKLFAASMLALLAVVTAGYNIDGYGYFHTVYVHPVDTDILVGCSTTACTPVNF